MKKKGTILAENLIFIILNLVFIIILILFIAAQGGGAILIEQEYAKQIALLIDSAKPISIINLNMDRALELAEKNNIPFEDVVSINGNVVKIKLSDDSGYEYSFFNNVNVVAFEEGNPRGIYTFTINEKVENE